LDLLTIQKIFNALGNDRPQILIQLEDCVLEGIIAISEGMPREEAMCTVYTQLSSLKMDLGKDINALSWFNLSLDALAVPSTPPSEFLSTPMAPSVSVGDLRFNLKEMIQGQWCFFKGREAI
jgi:hypothetical protein